MTDSVEFVDPEETEAPRPTLPLTATDELLPEFVTFVENVLPVYLIQNDGEQRVWCDQWRAHPDALHRLYAIWQMWELAASGEITLHSFIRDVLDWHQPHLIDRDTGAFRRCLREHREPIALA